MNEVNLIHLVSTSATDPQGAERRFALLQRHRELAEHFVSQSLDKDVAVLIFDLNEFTDVPGVTSDFLQEVRDDGCIPARVVGMSRWTAYRRLKDIQRHLHKLDVRNPRTSTIVENLRHPAPAGLFNVLVLSHGKQLVQWPFV